MLQPIPPGFKDHLFSFSTSIQAPSHTVWQWLNDTRTFTDTQVWPYKVEFYSPEEEQISSDFSEGVFTNHSGPFMSFAGKLVTIKEDYRDLQYFYGSYALSFRWVRPYRLEFRTEEKEGYTLLHGTISCYVKPGIYSIWTRLQRLFWSRFRRWSTKSILKIQRSKTNQL